MPPQNLPNLRENLSPEQLPIGWPWRLFLFSLLVMITAVVAYLGLDFGYKPLLSNQISSADQALTDLTKSISKEDQNKLINFYSQLVNLQDLLKNHPNSSRFFVFLSNNTNQSVYYSAMDVKLDERRLSLEGMAQSYDVFSQQLEVFNRSPEVENMIVTDSSVANNQVRFRLLLTLKPSLFGLK